MILSSARLLGLLNDNMAGWYEKADLLKYLPDDSMKTILKAWKIARIAKDFDAADKIRERAEQVGLKLTVTAEGPAIAHPQAPSEEWRNSVVQLAEALK